MESLYPTQIYTILESQNDVKCEIDTLTSLLKGLDNITGSKQMLIKMLLHNIVMLRRPFMLEYATDHQFVDLLQTHIISFTRQDIDQIEVDQDMNTSEKAMMRYMLCEYYRYDAQLYYTHFAELKTLYAGLESETKQNMAERTMVLGLYHKAI